MRLWSVVVTQAVTRPSFQVGATVSALTATGRLLCRRLAQLRRRADVRDEGVVLAPVPAAPDGGHVVGELRRVLALGEKADQRLAVRQRPVARDRRADVALAGETVALGADRFPLLLAETLRLLAPRRV